MSPICSFALSARREIQHGLLVAGGKKKKKKNATRNDLMMKRSSFGGTQSGW